MADFLPTTFVNDGPPYVNADELNKFGAGIQDAIRAWKFGTLAGRPAAGLANRYWAYFATDDNGGTPYVNFDGATWTKVAPGLSEAGGGGGGATWLFDEDVTGVSYVDIPGLSGDTEIEYEIIVDGLITTGGAGRNVTVRPNNITANTYNSYRVQSRAAAAVTATPSAGPYDGGGLMLGYTDTPNSVVLARAKMSARSGLPRLIVGEFMTSTGSTAVYDIEAQGRWEDTTTVINSLRIDFGGGTFTGRVRVRPL